MEFKRPPGPKNEKGHFIEDGKLNPFERDRKLAGIPSQNAAIIDSLKQYIEKEKENEPNLVITHALLKKWVRNHPELFHGLRSLDRITRQFGGFEEIKNRLGISDDADSTPLLQKERDEIEKQKTKEEILSAFKAVVEPISCAKS
jgi:hypothetical protein